jgi:NAD(P)-dependent dehydrogenase (short-subunit alcohol dehydrogenase family)
MSHASLDVSGRVCLITGGTTGIGRTLALGFAEAGARVVAGSSNADKVAAIRKELGGEHDAVPLDVTDEQSVARAVGRARDRFGRIDALVNAAGVTKKQPAIDMPVAEFERIVRVNLTGSYTASQAVARVMRGQQPDARNVRGAIINIASIGSFTSLVDVTAYCCAKTAVLALTRGLANEWAPLGIRVNAIAPGVFPTDLNRHLIEGTPRGEWFKQHTPVGRFGDTTELLAAAIYLISPGASFTTGHTLVVDGGFLAKGV